MAERSSFVADEGEALASGWERDTEPDTLLRAYTDGFADMCAHIAAGAGGRVERTEHLTLADAGSPAAYLNGAVITAPLDDSEVDDAVRHAQRFFAAGRGGPWILLAPTPIRDLRHLGLAPVGHPPFMVRGVGGTRRDPPPDLEVIEITDPADLLRFERACIDFYPMPEVADRPPGTVFPVDALLATDDYRWFLGLVDGSPVGTAMAHASPGAVHVEWITSDPQRRGRGYGEAMTWAATLAWPDRPATLIASDDGRATYERMGYLPVTRVTMWAGTRASA